MTRRLPLIIGGVAVVVVIGLVVVVLASDGTGTTQRPATVGAPPPSATVAAATTTPARSTVVLAMGHTGDPANTFYELFERSAGRSTWTLVTPPGVADNGGLVVGQSAAGSLTTGFLPSGALTFSVLAASSDGGTTWAPGEVPGALAPWPDALASGPGGQVYAVLDRPSPVVVGSAGGLASWSREATVSQLTASTTHCSVTAVTAVGVTGGGTLVVGTRCTDSTGAGLFVRTPTAGGTAGADGGASGAGPSGWTYVGAGVGGSAPSTSTVLRLQAVPGGVAAVVEHRSGPTASVIGVWAGGGGTGAAAPSASAPLAVPAGWSVRATAIGGGGGGSVAVLLASASGPGLRIGTLAGPGAGWVTAGTVPAGTTAIATVGDETDGFVPSGSTLVVWTSTAGSPWRRTATVSVPIQYGSSG